MIYKQTWRILSSLIMTVFRSATLRTFFAMHAGAQELRVAQKLELVKKLKKGASVTSVWEEHGVAEQTVSELESRKIRNCTFC